jgi:class 3 adenylate cyclase/TolB-like protein/tetratricopeptide (TPR) repeat protein
MDSTTVIRRLAAIVIADVVGYTRLMERDDTGTYARVRMIRDEVVDPAILSHGGRIVKTAGDGLVAEFTNALSALRAAIQIQRQMEARKASAKADERIDYRIGINLGDIMVDGNDIAGDGVNVASRLEALAEPGGICVSAGVYEQVHGQLDVEFVDGGEQSVKNIARPIRVFRVAFANHAPSRPQPRAVLRQMYRKRWTWPVGLSIALLLASVTGWSILHTNKPVNETRAVAVASAAILPWDSKGGSASDDQLSAQLGDEFASKFPAGFREIRFLAPNAISKAAAVDPRALGRDLGIRYIVDGNVQRLGDRATIRVGIVDARSGVQLWSDETDFLVSSAEERDVIMPRIISRVRVGFYKILRLDPEQTPAMKLVYRADALDYNSRTDLLEARRLYDEAIRIEPDLVLALVRRGWNMVAELEFDPGQDRDRLVDDLVAFSARAIDVDAGDPRSWDLRAVALGWQANLAAAFEAEARTRQLDPAFPYNVRAWLLLMNGQPEQALEATDKGVFVEPRAIQNYALMRCWSHLLLDQYDRAISECEKWRASDDRWFYVYPLLTAAYAQTGNLTKAAAAKTELLKRIPNYTIARYVALQKSDSPRYAELTEQHILSGLRKAGIPDR